MTRATAAARARASRRMPDFAGVALVDILANGVAMLIIVIVVSIAARMEREERYAEQASEVAAVMSHKFSTSLVLNSLAASPPARLHDYETSPLDQLLHPNILPILEMHRGFVREFYSGTIWTRRNLLEERSGLGTWLAGLTDDQKGRLRIDVYDVPQFYLTMSILREHGIKVYHWHFLTGALTAGEAASCPGGVAAKDCPGGGGEAPAPLPQLALDDQGSGGPGNLDTPPIEPPFGGGRGSSGAGTRPGFMPGGTGSAPGPLPGNVVPGVAGSAGAGFSTQGATSGTATETAGAGLQPGSGSSGAADEGRGAGEGSGLAGAERGLLSGPQGADRGRGFGTGPGLDSGAAATLGSFPGAREGGTGPGAGEGVRRAPREGASRDGRRGRASQAGSGTGGTGPQMNLRIALPESIRRAAQSGGEVAPALEALFGIVLHYLGELQDSLDTGGTPSPQIEGFAERIQQAFRAPPPITDGERRIARDLALKFALLPHLGTPGLRPGPLALHPVPQSPGSGSGPGSGLGPGSGSSSGPGSDAVLVIAPNRLNDAVWVDRGVGASHADTQAGEKAGEGAPEGVGPDGEVRGGAFPPRGRAALALNAYPGIWQGLEIRIEPYSVVLMPPEIRQPERMRWRAVAYITPRLDDFIVGFVFADMDTGGRLRIQADANRVRLEGRPLFTEYRESAFGSRGWLVTLYAVLAAGLALLGVGWRFLAVRAA